MLARRGLLAGLGLLAAPAIIRTPGLLMPVRVWLNGGIPPGGGRLLLEATERYEIWVSKWDLPQYWVTDFSKGVTLHG